MTLRAFPVLYAREVERVAWGERLAFVQDPEGNVVTLATAAG